MSWDVSIFKFERIYPRMEDIPRDVKGLILGSRAEIQQAVSAVFPGTDWNDPAWGIWRSVLGVIEFNAGKDPVDGMMLHVCADSVVAAAIVQLCRNNQWQALDCSSCDFIDQVKHPEKGLEAWAAFKKRVIDDAS